ALPGVIAQARGPSGRDIPHHSFSLVEVLEESVGESPGIRVNCERRFKCAVAVLGLVSTSKNGVDRVLVDLVLRCFFATGGVTPPPGHCSGFRFLRLEVKQRSL